MYFVRDIPSVRYVPLAREKQGFISYRIERSEIYRILYNKIYRTSPACISPILRCQMPEASRGENLKRCEAFHPCFVVDKIGRGTIAIGNGGG